MEQITANHPLSKSADIIKQNVDTLKSLFPTIVKEGKIDVKELKALLGEEIETSEEYYRFTWAGKSMARQEANKPSTGTLRPVKEESKDWDKTQNIFIEGDNLEVLKLLQKSYANKIKVIYIDPPYNTGKDFVYKDNYADNLGNYLAITGQTDEEGKKLSTNTESDGRYHSNWLNMMYPRLKLARNLLKEDGAIFISIDDNEVQNLRKLCDEILGEENFVANISWQKKYAVSNDDDGINAMHDYIMVYQKSSAFERLLLPRTEKQLNRYQNPDNDERGEWSSGEYVSSKTKSQRPTLWYPIKHPKTGEDVWPEENAVWRYSKEKHEELERENRLYWGADLSYKKPRLKRFLNELQDGVVPSTWWTFDEVGHNDEGQKETAELIGKKVFSTPKPVRLLKRILEISIEKEGIVLDFFAGSGSTADAVMQLNAADGGDRRFVCVQLPETTEGESEAYKAGFKTIAEITKERIRRAGEKAKLVAKADLFSNNGRILDIGFKVFKLDNSNINSWDGNVQNFERTLLSAAENIKPDRIEEDVLYEILLKSGLDLAQPIEEKTIAGKKVFNIGLGALFICLANDLTTAVAEGIGKWKQELEPFTCRVIFKDTGFNDVEKTNSIQILKRYGINEVNTI